MGESIQSQGTSDFGKRSTDLDTLEDLEKTIQMGFREGFAMGLNQLDELLTTLKKPK